MANSDAERAKVEQELTSILNRALKNAQLVRLDMVDEVLKMFQEALELMESNLQLDEEEEAADAAQAKKPSVIEGQNRLLALAGSASTATTANSSNASSTNSSDTEENGRPQPVINKAVSGLANAALTVDYSSPSSKTRSLGGKAAAKAAAPAGDRPSSLGLGLGLGLHHKPSSRATTGLSALASGAQSPVSPTTPDDAPEPAQAPTPSHAADVASGPMGLKNKALAKVQAAPGNREFPSPKLGPRSLTAAKGSAPSTPQQSTVSAAPAVAAPSNPAAAGLSLPIAESLGRDAPGGPVNGGQASPEEEEAVDEDEAGDLIRTDKKNNTFARVKNTLPVTASPKQIRSSFVLLDLAKNHGLQGIDDDLTMKAQGGAAGTGSSNGPSDRPSGAAMNAGGVLSSLPSGLVKQVTGSTPKPDYLRRLDSPDTHHGQLKAARERLVGMLNRGLVLAGKVRLDKAPEIKTSLEQALAKLEHSIVQSSLSGPPPQ